MPATRDPSTGKFVSSSSTSAESLVVPEYQDKEDIQGNVVPSPSDYSSRDYETERIMPLNNSYHQLAIKQSFKGVLEFSGERMGDKGATKCEDFIRSVDVALALTQVPETLAITYIVSKLKGSARHWYEQHQVDNLAMEQNLIRTWVALKAHLLKRFGSDLGVIQYEREIYSMSQGSQTVSAFADQFQAIINKIANIPSNFVVAMFVNRLEESIGRLVRSHSDNLADLKTAIRAAILVEAQIHSSRGTQGNVAMVASSYSRNNNIRPYSNRPPNKFRNKHKIANNKHFKCQPKPNVSVGQHQVL